MSARTRASSAAGGGDSFLVVAALDTPARLKSRADYVCDGTNLTGGDEVEINTALGVANVVILCPGTFWTTQPIRTASYKSLISGGAGCIIKFMDGINANRNMIENSDQVNGNDNIVVKDLTLDGNRANNNAGVQRGIYFVKVGSGIGVNAVPGCHVEGCFAKNFRDSGIYIYQSNNCVIIGNTCEYNLTKGIMVEHLCYYVNVVSNNCHANGNHGISIEDQSQHITVASNVCTNNVKGIIIEITMSHCTIVGNICNYNSYGIQLIGAQRCCVVGNHLSNNEQFGITLTDASHHNSVVGNICIGNSTGANNAKDDIYVADNADFNFIAANMCRAGALTNKPRYGVNIATADCASNLVINNDLYNDGFGTAPFNDAGTGTIENDNRGNVGHYQTADYGVAWVNWVAGIVGVACNGTRCVFYNTNGVGAYRLGCYANGAWHYVDLT